MLFETDTRGKNRGMHFQGGEHIVPGRLNRRSGANSYTEIDEPFINADQRKKRWLLATTVTGISGAAIIMSALYLTMGSGGSPLTTRPIKQMAQITSGNEKAIAQPSRTGAPVTTPAMKQDRLQTASLGPSDIDRKREESLLRDREYRKTLPTPLQSAIKPQTPVTATDIIVRKDAGKIVLKALPVENKKTSALSLGKPTVLPARPGKETASTDLTLIVTRGDTLYSLLTRNGISKKDAQAVAKKIGARFPLKKLKAGHRLSMALQPDPQTGKNRPARVKLNAGKKSVSVQMDGTDSAPSSDKPKKLASIQPKPKKQIIRSGYHRARARIQKSFYQSAIGQNLPQSIVNRMTHVLSYDIDFQREVNRGDVFEVLYSGDKGKDNGVLYSELVASGKKHAYYRFKTPDGITAYYNKKGAGAKKSLIRTPVSYSRITSGFGRRRHPTLGYNKMHTGVDFGATRGTPIYAAANGRIEKAGWAGGYGKYVRIRHSKKMETAYAHMSRIARGMRPGKKVSQGQIIGYVGSTGRTTGPHLHYEIRIAGKPVNPMRYRMAGKKTHKLKGNWLALFKKEKRRIDNLRRKTPVTTRVATAQN